MSDIPDPSDDPSESLLAEGGWSRKCGERLFRLRMGPDLFFVLRSLSFLALHHHDHHLLLQLLLFFFCLSRSSSSPAVEVKNRSSSLLYSRGGEAANGDGSSTNPFRQLQLFFFSAMRICTSASLRSSAGRSSAITELQNGILPFFPSYSILFELSKRRARRRDFVTQHP